jgi:branched-chain amino acid transport system permease protein
MTLSRSVPAWLLALLAAAVAGAALFPLIGSDYAVGLGISLLSYAVLATAWALFSGPTRYITLATVAFFGIGAYTAAVTYETLSWPLLLAVAALIGALVAAVVGLSTLRLSGVYFVIFTFGLAELIRQLVTWFEVNVSRSLGRYVFVDISSRQIYWQLLALAVVTFGIGWLIKRSRTGLALRMIGDDEGAARHFGVNTTRVKLSVFILTSVLMTLTGAIMVPRWIYLDPVIAFNPTLSFQVVIMALLGGAGALFGPLLGVIPLVLLFEVISANFPNHFSILLGVTFIIIVYFLPRGVTGLLSQWKRKAAPGSRTQLNAGEPAVPDAAQRPLLQPQVPLMPQPAAAPRKGTGSDEGELLLEVSGLQKNFGGLTAVGDTHFHVNRGEILGLIGPNGSGKTTTLNLISGVLRPDQGQVSLAGRDITGRNPEWIARHGVARTFQLVRVFRSMTSLENVLPGLLFRPEPLRGAAARQAALELLNRVGLGGRADVPAGDLAYIDQKRLELARALALDPQLLLLDEWLAGLNPSELVIGIDLLRSLRTDGVTMIMVEHVMEAIRSLCDRCVVMDAGRKIAEGTPALVLADSGVVHAYLGVADA